MIHSISPSLDSGGQQTTGPETLITCPFCKKLLPDHQSLQIHVADEHDQ